MKIPQTLIDALPDGDAVGQCEILMYADDRVDAGPLVSDPETRPVIVAPGWWADDGNAEVEYPTAETAREAIEKYIAEGDYLPCGGSVEICAWRTGLGSIPFCAWRTGLMLDDDGNVVCVDVDRQELWVEIDDTECDADEDVRTVLHPNLGVPIEQAEAEARYLRGIFG